MKMDCLLLPEGGAPPAPLVDVQGFPDSRHIAIQKVGVRALRVPVRVAGRDGRLQPTVGELSMTVSLAHDRRGAHLSRFLEMLNDGDREVSLPTFQAWLADMRRRLDAREGHIELRFPYFLAKAAPVSGVQSLMDYDAALLGTVTPGATRVDLQVTVPVTSLCPCSKEIARYGAHNQRSRVTVTAQAVDGLWLDDLIRLVEAEASCELYALLKRPDEKYVTERAYDNPKFVEDTVRDLAARLARDPRVGAYTVECENFESIHNHSAYALIASEQSLPF